MVIDLFREKESRIEMRLMIDFELVIEVRDMEESFVDVVINLKE